METESFPYPLPISHDNKIKLITIPNADIKFKDFITLVETKLQLKPNWKQFFQIFFKYQCNLYPITNEDDIHIILKNKVKLVRLFPVEESPNLKESKMKKSQNQMIRQSQWLPDPAKSGAFDNSKSIHKSKCEGCGIKKIVGQRFKCCFCVEFNYCEKCYIDSIKNKKHRHTSFISIAKSKEYDKEAQEYFENKIKSENEMALEMRKAIIEGFEFEVFRHQYISNSKPTAEKKMKQSKISEDCKEETVIEEEKINGYEEKDDLNKEEMNESDGWSLIKDDRNIVDSLELLHNKNEAMLNDINNKYDEHKGGCNGDIGVDLDAYCELFEDKEQSNEISLLIQEKAEDDIEEDKLFITLNNNMKIISLNFDHSKKWESIEVPFDTNCPDIRFYHKTLPNIELSLCYVSLPEKKIKFMFENTENYSIGTLFVLPFVLYSISSDKIIKSQESSIVIVIK